MVWTEREVWCRAAAGLALWLLSLVVASPAQAQQVQHLGDLEALRQVCQHASPEPPTGADARAWALARQRGVTRLYSVDVQPQHFNLAEYDRKKQLLAVVDQDSFGLFDGSYAVAPRGSLLLAFELPEEDAQSVQMDCGAQTAVLRLVFMLDAVKDVEQPWCRADEQGTTVVQARLLSARLFKTPAAGEDNPAARRELARTQDPEATAMARAIGAWAPKDQAPLRPVVEAQKPRVVQGNFSPQALESLRRDAQLLVRPCHLASLARGGPERAALSINVEFDDGGHPREIVPAVDAAGHQGLVRCSQRSLRRLRAPSSARGDLLRLNFYFERR